MTDPTAYKCKSNAASPIVFVLLAPYRCKVWFDSGEWGIFGRGSLDLAKSVNVFHDTDISQPSIIVGDFCEMAAGCQILLGGEHRNDLVFNNALAHFPLVKHYCKEAGNPYKATFSRGPVCIGHNVVISQRALIRSGIRIGNGAVIGADASVLHDVPDFAIVVGSPATILRKRFDDETIAALLELRWWDWSLAFFLRHFPMLYEVPPAELAEHARTLDISYDKQAEEYVVLTAKKDGQYSCYQCEGVERNGVFTPLAELPESARDYLLQTKAPTGSEVMVRHDLFSMM